jgi:hypothetical protein
MCGIIIGAGKNIVLKIILFLFTRASFLAKSTVDALGHINIVTSGLTTSILSLISLNSNSLDAKEGCVCEIKTKQRLKLNLFFMGKGGGTPGQGKLLHTTCTQCNVPLH